MLANYAGAQEAKETKVITYPAPVTEKVLSTYTVTVNGKPLDIYKALSPKFEGGEYYFTYFDFEGVVDVKVVSRKPMKRQNSSRRYSRPRRRTELFLSRRTSRLRLL